MVSCNNWSSNSNFQIGSWKWEQNKISFKLLNLNCFHKPDFFYESWILQIKSFQLPCMVLKSKKTRRIGQSYFLSLKDSTLCCEWLQSSPWKTFPKHTTSESERKWQTLIYKTCLQSTFFQNLIIGTLNIALKSSTVLILA